jgi:hypothetical protein
MAKLRPLAVWGVVKDLRAAVQDERPIAVGGVLAEQLQKELARDGSPGAVRAGPAAGAAALVRVLAGAPTAEDEEELRRARRARVPVVAVQTSTDTFDVPYVLATDVVPCSPGAGFPLEEIAAALATAVPASPRGFRSSGRPCARS